MQASIAFPYGTRTPWSRVAGAIVVGVLAGWLTSGALEQGAGLFFGEASLDEGPRLFWGKHELARVIGSICATILAGFIAGAVARSKGGMVALAAAAPATLRWAVVAVPSALVVLETDQHVLAATLVVMTPFVAFRAGETGAAWAQRFGSHFDARPKTLLGVHWYHYLWIPFNANFIVAQSACLALYAAVWLERLWNGGVAGLGITSVVPALFLTGIYFTLTLLVRGWSSAYAILSGQRSSPRPSLDVLKFAFGYPIAAVACQSAMIWAQQMLVKLANSN